MMVAATIVADTQVTAAGTAIHMAAQSGGPATSHSIKGTQLLTVTHVAILNL